MSQNQSPSITSGTTDPSRWALVTGASAGIGESFSRHLASMGYHLVLVARRADRLYTLSDELREQYGTAALVLPADLSEPGASADIARRLADKDISIEFLVNNAGYGLPGRFTEVSWSQHADFIQVMMTAVCELTHHLLPAMQERKCGHVINVASVAGLVAGSEGHTLYGASKAFLVSYTQSLALENLRHGVKVSALCPGFTYSEFHDVSGTRDLVNKLPKHMWLDADEVVKYGIDSVTRDQPRVVAIPGFYYRALVWVNDHIQWVGKLAMKRMSKRFRHLEGEHV